MPARSAHRSGSSARGRFRCELTFAPSSNSVIGPQGVQRTAGIEKAEKRAESRVSVAFSITAGSLLRCTMSPRPKTALGQTEKGSARAQRVRSPPESGPAKPAEMGVSYHSGHQRRLSDVHCWSASTPNTHRQSRHRGSSAQCQSTKSLRDSPRRAGACRRVRWAIERAGRRYLH